MQDSYVAHRVLGCIFCLAFLWLKTTVGLMRKLWASQSENDSVALWFCTCGCRCFCRQKIRKWTCSKISRDQENKMLFGPYLPAELLLWTSWESYSSSSLENERRQRTCFHAKWSTSLWCKKTAWKIIQKLLW